MRINHNIAALNTYNKLSSNQATTSKSLEKLSSGLRINKAGDDAAGLAISEKMRGQIRGLDQASRNASDGISLIQTAEGALNETHSILQRMRELAVQSSNDTNTDDDRAEIQKEISQLTEEITRISTDTEFNTKKLLDGSISNSATISATANDAELNQAAITDDNLVAGDYTATITGVTTSVGSLVHGGTNISSVAITGTDIALGDYSLELTANGSNFDAVLKNSNGDIVASEVNQAISNANGGGDATLEIGGIEFTWAESVGASNVTAGAASVSVSTNATFEVADSEGNILGGTTITGNKTGEVSVGGFELSFDSDLAEDVSTITVATNAMSFQIGSNSGQDTKISISDMSATELGIDAINLSTKEGATSAIDTIDSAIATVSSERAKLGGMQNRLEHTINNLGTTSENLAASESRIRDVDMAKEMMEFTKNNILSQAAQAMLAQANQQPQGVLQLLQ